MPPGPILIFDKSLLQSLSVDEAMWLDYFFLVNITPLFFIETLADLEKEVGRGRTPEQVVGNLAIKTPDLHSHPNAHHQQLLYAELFGKSTVPMDGRIPRASGTTVVLGDQQGVLYKESDEEAALNRWQRQEFLDLERQTAKEWRRHTSQMSVGGIYDGFKRWFEYGGKPKELSEAKALAQRSIDKSPNVEATLRLGLSLLNFPPSAGDEIINRWNAAGQPAIRDFAPYFHYVYTVTLFFCLAVAADLISRVRPAGKADNLVDLAYLYYLPFCMVFTSSDNLHERLVPLFLRPDQSFVHGPFLKVGLRAVDAYYSQLPEDIRARGLYAFADGPPQDPVFVLTQLWDRHLPRWRLPKAPKLKTSPEVDHALQDLITKFRNAPRAPASEGPVTEPAFVEISRQLVRSKGKWVRFPPEAK